MAIKNAKRQKIRSSIFRDMTSQSLSFQERTIHCVPMFTPGILI